MNTFLGKISVLLMTTTCLSLSGCALQWYDVHSGTEHLFGFGHFKMRVVPPSEGVQAVVSGSDVVGVSLGSLSEQTWMSLGWNRVQRLDVLKDDAVLRVEYPSSDFATVRIGTSFPSTTMPTGNDYFLKGR